MAARAAATPKTRPLDPTITWPAALPSSVSPGASAEKVAVSRPSSVVVVLLVVVEVLVEVVLDVGEVNDELEVEILSQ